MINNIVRGNPISSNDLWLAFNEIIENYTRDNIATIEFVEVVKVNGVMLDVKPVLQHKDTSGNIIAITDNDIIHNIPVMMLGGGNIDITFKLSVGDIGVLLSCKYDISDFKQNKTISSVSSRRIFDNANGIFLPVRIKNISEELVLRNNNASIIIKPDNLIINGNIEIIGDIKLNGKIEASGDVVGSGISLKNHIHKVSGTGFSAGGAPVVGTATSQKPQ